jgi:hypothetical protein
MFINNKYTNCYISLIAQAQARELPQGTYTEKHHIIPKCMEGPDTKDNLVRLTAKEHYVAHLLLTKMTEGVYQQKMCFALWRMMHDPKKRDKRHWVSASQYEKIKIQMAEHISIQNQGRKLTPEQQQRQKAGMSNRGGPWNKGKKMSPEFGEAVRKRRTGSTATEETSRKISVGIQKWNKERVGTPSSLKGRKIPRYTTIIQHKQTKEQFVTTHQNEWLKEKGLKRHALERGTCDYEVVRRFVTSTGVVVPLKRK